MNTAKDFVQSRYPHALYHYKDRWCSISRRFIRAYSIYQDNELDVYNSFNKKIGEGRTVEEAWDNARHNIEVGII